MASAPSDSSMRPRGRPLVSAVIPTYNRASTVGDTLESALNQTYGQLEIIVVDDGSTDDTPDVLTLYGDSITIVRQDNRGVAAARNTGIERSQGSIVMFLDSDDLWLPRAVETQVDLLEAAGTASPCAMCNLTMRSEDGTDVTMFTERKLRADFDEGLWMNVQDVLATRFLFTNQTLAIRREALDAVAGFDDRLWVMEDFDIAMRLAALGPWAYTTELLAIRQDGSSNSLTASAHKDPERLYETMLAICRNLIAQGVPSTRVARLGTSYMARKAARNLRLTQSNGGTRATISRGQILVEEKLIERAYRNSRLFPRIESTPL